MSRSRSVVLAMTFLLFFSSACSKPQVLPEAEKGPQPEVQKVIVDEEEQVFRVPQRIILFIGDGMGVASLTAATYARGELLHMLTMPHAGFNTTHEHEFITTDSAAAATALATGHKTHFEGVSVVPGTTAANEEEPERHLTTLMGGARKQGMRTGLVATSRINHATPAAFGAHRAHRNSYEAIALDMSTYGVDVLLGAGSTFFEERKDGRDLFQEMSEAGYLIGRTADEVRDHAGIATRLVGLMHSRDMPSVQSGERAMSLAEMVEHSLTILDRDNEQGFVLMVEGSQIDWFGHDLDGVGLVAETLDMDEAVGVALRYARQRQDTLVVVTADHETGGLDVLDPVTTDRFTRILGGEGGALRLAMGTNSGEAEEAPPLAHLGLGADAVKAVTSVEASKNSFVFGPPEVDDRRFTTAFGYLSQASRPLWDRSRGHFSATHTAVMVPLLAQGPGAEYVVQTIDNADLGARLHELVMASRDDASPVMKSAASQTERPRNVILLIGDGMGIAPVTAALYAHGSLAMLSLPVKGLVATHGTDRVVNDSAATATALATGFRTRYGAVGMAPVDGALKSVPTVLERASAGGLRTGLVTTTTITHATPGSFYAHEPNRSAEPSIAGQFVDFARRVEGAGPIDVAMGGGADFFTKEGIEDLQAQGVIVERGWSPAPIVPGQPTLRLLAAKGLPNATTRRSASSEVPTLAAMTEGALDALKDHEAGFFLMVEGGQIDWALHGLGRGEELIDEIIDFDEAVAAAVAFAREDGETLVIVTADHDHTLSILDNHYGFNKGRCGVAVACGGEMPFEGIPVAIDRLHRSEGLSDEALQGEFASPVIFLQYSWIVMAARERVRTSGPHSANFVPLFAYGPWASRVGGFRDQPEIGKVLMEWANSTP